MTPDEAVARLIDRQHGVIAPEQAYALDMSRGAFRHRVRTGRLIEVYAGSYRARSSPPTFRQDAMAASLSAGAGAVISDESAAMAFGIRDEKRGEVHVTVPPNRNPEITGLIVHRRRIARADCTFLGPLPVMTIPRTLADIAGALSERDLAEATDRAFRRRLITPERLLRTIVDPRFDRVKGIAVLRRIVRDRLEHGVPGSVLEADALDVLRDFRLPAPDRQVPARVKGRKVLFDLAYEEQHLVLELEGQTPHTEFATWQSDHNRRNAVELDETWKALYFTWWDVHDTPVYFAATVADRLGLKPTGWRKR